MSWSKRSSEYICALPAEVIDAVTGKLSVLISIRDSGVEDGETD
jgi:hypothetical protein